MKTLIKYAVGSILTIFGFLMLINTTYAADGIISPVEGETIYVGNKVEIKWDPKKIDAERVEIFFFNEKGGRWDIARNHYGASQQTLNDGSYVWEVPPMNTKNPDIYFNDRVRYAELNSYIQNVERNFTKSFVNQKVKLRIRNYDPKVNTSNNELNVDVIISTRVPKPTRLDITTPAITCLVDKSIMNYGEPVIYKFNAIGGYDKYGNIEKEEDKKVRSLRLSELGYSYITSEDSKLVKSPLVTKYLTSYSKPQYSYLNLDSKFIRYFEYDTYIIDKVYPHRVVPATVFSNNCETFVRPPKLTLNESESTITLTNNRENTIKWSTENVVNDAYVLITLGYNTWSNVFEVKVPNTGSYTFSLPSNIIKNTSYILSVSAVLEGTYLSTETRNIIVKSAVDNKVNNTTVTTPTAVKPNCYLPTKNLEYLATGDDVAALQRFLVSKGYTVPTTSYFGGITYTYLVAYQKSVGIAQTGKLDQTTRTYIANSCGNLAVTINPIIIPAPVKPVAQVNPQTVTATIDHSYGKTLQTGSSYDIDWRIGGDINFATDIFTIELYDSSMNVNAKKLIKNGLTGYDKSYKWSIPTSITGGKYYVKVSSQNTTAGSGFTTAFNIETPKQVYIPSVNNMPYINYVSPSSAKAGDLVTIHGRNFNNTHPDVTINSDGMTRFIKHVSKSDTAITFLTPNFTPNTTHLIGVTSKDGIGIGPIEFTIIPKPEIVAPVTQPVTPPSTSYTTPHISRISPSSGVAGTIVTIEGVNFEGVDAYTIFLRNNKGGEINPDNVVVTSTRITFKVPNTTYGTYSVSLLGDKGDSNTVNFTITAPPTNTSSVLDWFLSFFKS